MIEKGVSDILYNLIVQLMSVECLSSFNLGGGTNLAIRYNHRESVDIDLFSEGVVGVEKMEEIAQYIESTFKGDGFAINRENFGSNRMAFLSVNILQEGIPVKIDIIQNLPLNHEIDVLDNIRLINELDIGALKLVAACNRGTQKDFYDLVLLANFHSFDTLYKELMDREGKFVGEKYGNIFNNNGLRSGLSGNLSPLADFTKASDKAIPGNRIKLTVGSPVNMIWPVLREKWRKVVGEYATLNGLNFNPPDPKEGRKARRITKFGF